MEGMRTGHISHMQKEVWKKRVSKSQWLAIKGKDG